MSDEFRELLKKVGSGTHTGQDLSRSEAATATMMMLQQQATPAQIGAFAIAHRIKRPTPTELAGMLDAYDRLGAKLDSQNQTHKPVVFGNPYDGRSRTIPVTVITALILASADIPTIMHGGDCMPTKYGIPLIEIWQKLGVDFSGFSLSKLETFIAETGIGLVYIPQHFPQAHALVPYRDQIGKRPPFATVELIWNPVIGDTSLVSGFVHPPTEERFRATFALRGVEDFTTVKGLEGSCDLACSRTAIIGIGKPQQDFERLLLHPVDYGLDGRDVVIESKQGAIAQMRSVINGDRTSLMSAAILNGGFYLWRFGICSSLAKGFTLAEDLIIKGKIAAKLNQLQQTV
jgi:anthranilate phosphoribosyltransferase